MFQYFRTLGITTKLWLLVASFSMVILGDNLAEMVMHSKRLRAEKELQLEQLVESAHALLQHYQKESAHGRLTDAEAQRQAMQAVRSLRYSEREYFWIHDLTTPEPRMIMHPTAPELDGKVLSDTRFKRATAMRNGTQGAFINIDRHNLFVAMNEAIASTGVGLVAYDWPKPLSSGGVSEQLYPKLSFVKRFDPWAWVIGSGIYIDDMEAEFWRDMQLRLIKAALWLVLLGILVWALTQTIAKPLRLFQRNIDALRDDPDGALRLATDQPDELGRLANSSK